MNAETVSRARISGDIVSVLSIAKSIGWNQVSDQSIYRIIYLASVVYAFRFPNLRNPFEADYHFSVDALGPYSDDIRKSLLVLESNSYVDKLSAQSQSIRLGTNPVPLNISQLPDYDLKYNWLSDIIYILGIYGEGRIYEFIIRDPEYRNNLQNNVVQGLDISAENNTVEYLLSFKAQFESTLGDEAKQIDSREYLELYFEYIFSKVLKRLS